MSVSTIRTYFYRKPRCLDDLLVEEYQRRCRVQAVKVILLSQEQYQHFISHIWEDMPFFSDNKRLTDCDSTGINHCLLVTTRTIRGGILVDCQGYNYARYAANLPDKSVLDLRDVPVERYDLKPRQPRRQQER